MIKNKAGQVVSFLMLNASGAPVTSGTPTVYYTIEGGTQQVGGGTAQHEGNGEWSYVPLKAETNGDQISFLMELAGAISKQVNIYPLTQAEAAAATLPSITTKNLADMRVELAARLGFAANNPASLNTTLLDSFLIRAQESLWRRMEFPSNYGEVDKWVAPGETKISYPTELDAHRITSIVVDYTGGGDWYELVEGVEYYHDTISDLETWPRRFERHHDGFHLWPAVQSFETIAVSAITLGAETTVTLSSAPSTTLNDGARILFDGGTTVELSSGIYTAYNHSGTSFKLHDSTGSTIDSTGYTAYTSGGQLDIGWKLRFAGQRNLASFSADTDYPTLPEDLVLEAALLLGKAHYRHPDYSLIAAQHQRRLELIRGQAHGNRRYVPNKTRNGIVREMVRPRIVQ